METFGNFLARGNSIRVANNDNFQFGDGGGGACAEARRGRGNGRKINSGASWARKEKGKEGVRFRIDGEGGSIG